MKRFKIFFILFFFTFSLYAQGTNVPKAAPKPKTEKKYIDLDELKAMKANGATAEEITARYNEMIEAIDRDFHGVPASKAQKKEGPMLGEKNVNPVITIKPLSL